MPTINVKDTLINEDGSIIPGALGDGATNDAITIQAHIDYIHRLGGGTLYFPPGRYAVEIFDGHTVDILRMHSNISLLGEAQGEGSTLVLARSQPASLNMISAVAASGVRILSLNFDGQEHLQRRGPDGEPRIDNLYEHQCGIWIQGCRDAFISNCRFVGMGGDAIRARLLFDRNTWRLTASRRLSVNNCEFINNRRVSVNFDGAVDSEVSSCTFRSEYSSEYIDAMEEICLRPDRTTTEITNLIDEELTNQPRPFTSHCFKMELDDSSSGPAGVISNNRFNNNRIIDCAGVSVSASADLSIVARRLEIRHNVFEFTDPYFGLFTRFPGVFNPSHPISLIHVEDVLVSGNYISRPAPTAGIRTAGCELVKIIGNTIIDPISNGDLEMIDHTGVIQITGNPDYPFYRRYGGRALVADNMISSESAANRSGIVIDDSVSGRITGNSVSGIGLGVYFRNSVQGYLVCRNRIRGNWKFGVLFNANAHANPSNNRIFANRIEGNGVAGVYCEAGTPLRFGIEVIENLFERNGEPGARIGIWHKGNGQITEDHNYWGCPDGPEGRGECNRIVTDGGPGAPTSIVYRGSHRIMREWAAPACPDLSEELEDLD